MRIGLYKTPSGRSPIEDFLGGLSKTDHAGFVEVYQGIKEYGLKYNEVTFRHLNRKLWEIKFSTEGGDFGWHTS